MDAIKAAAPAAAQGGQRQVALQNKASDQAEQVVGTLLAGVQATPPPAEKGKGENVNVLA